MAGPGPITVRWSADGVECGSLDGGDPEVFVYIVGKEIIAAVDKRHQQVWPDEREAERVEENLRTHMRRASQ